MQHPGPSSDRGLASLARATLDEHWAVAAIALDRRALLMERAEAAVLGAEGLGEPIADGLLLLGTAYELAAISQLDELATRDGSARDLAQAVLQSGASRALRCAAAMRPASEDAEAATRWALRVAALAVVAHEQELFLRWWELRRGVREAVQRFANTLDAEPWDRYAHGTIWLSWLGLLGAPVAPQDGPGGRPRTRERGTAEPLAPSALVATRARLAAFRERRAGQVGREEPTTLNAQGLRTRMSDFAIRHLADATELLTVAVIRRTLPDVSPQVRLHLSAARSALAGDHGLDLLLAWLQAAGLTLASGVTAQLDLPGL
jgi:hypothetical protein